MAEPAVPIAEQQWVEDASFGDLLTKLVDDTEQFVRAEVNLYRAEAMHRIALSRNAVIFGAVGLLLVLAAVGALLVGLILALAPLIGPLPATLVVIVVTLAVAGILLGIAWSRIKAAAAGEEPGR